MVAITKNTPMSSAPFVYNSDGTIAWEKMWTTFCTLAVEGGPPHRGTKLMSKGKQNSSNTAYKMANQELVRALGLLIPYNVTDADIGWIAISLKSPNIAKWYRHIIEEENVECRIKGKNILLPVNDNFTLEKEIKNVVTVVAKAYHYWKDHRTLAEKLYIYLFGIDIRWLLIKE